MVYILLGTGFEEAEALVTADVLRRGGVHTALAGIGGMKITGAHGITVEADVAAEAISLAPGDMLVMPGGMGGVNAMEGSSAAIALAGQALREDSLRLGAICAAPTLLARLGLLAPGTRAVCYPGMEDLLADAGVIPCMDVPVVKDGRLITGKGPGTVYDFALALLAELTDPAIADGVRAELHYGV